MASWLEDYQTALHNRDKQEKANADTIKAYAKLADRSAEVEAAWRNAQPPISTLDPPVVTSRLPARILGNPRSPPPSSETVAVASLRTDLMVANRDKSLLSTQLAAVTAELNAMRATSESQKASTAALQSQILFLEDEKASLLRKLRDRDSELKEKARLVENVQDEMLSLEMQINVAEEKATKLQSENKELVDRWMQRMGEEAEQMNEGSGWN